MGCGRGLENLPRACSARISIRRLIDPETRPDEASAFVGMEVSEKVSSGIVKLSKYKGGMRRRGREGELKLVSRGELRVNNNKTKGTVVAKQIIVAVHVTSGS